jgi:hypothetical protein
LNYHFQDLWSNSLGRICIGCWSKGNMGKMQSL